MPVVASGYELKQYSVAELSRVNCFSQHNIVGLGAVG